MSVREKREREGERIRGGSHDSSGGLEMRVFYFTGEINVSAALSEEES